MYITDNEQVRKRMDTMSEELNEARRKALDMTKKYQKAKEDLAKVPTMAGQVSKMGHDGVTTTISLLPTAGAAPIGRQHKFVGGGFNLAATPIL